MTEVSRKNIEDAVKHVLGYDLRSDKVSAIHRRIHIEASHDDSVTKDDGAMFVFIEQIRSRCENGSALDVLNEILERMPIQHLTAKAIQNAAAYLKQEGFKEGRDLAKKEWRAHDEDAFYQMKATEGRNAIEGC